MGFIIRSLTETDDETGEPLYWNNEQGWVDRMSADSFEYISRVDKPTDSVWIFDDPFIPKPALDDHVHGLMPKIHGPDWSSRDYDLPVIPCQLTICACNHNNKCTMPSAITISSGGRCETGMKYLADKERNPGPIAG